MNVITTHSETYADHLQDTNSRWASVVRHFLTTLPNTKPQGLVAKAQFSSVQGSIYALGKAHMRSRPSLESFPHVAFETVPMFV